MRTTAVALPALLRASLHAIESRFNDLTARALASDGQLTVFFSVCDGESRAHVTHFSGADLHAVWAKAERVLMNTPSRSGKPWMWLRVDWVSVVSEPITLGQLKQQWLSMKRNYYRYGLAFDANFECAFTEQELNANACLYTSGDVAHVTLNGKSFQHYSNSRFGVDLQLPLQEDTLVWPFQTVGVFAMGDEVHVLDTTPRDAGRRMLSPLDEQSTASVVQSASRYLSTQVRESGQFIYGHFPVFGQEIATYNTLRHASTVYAMLEAWELTRESDLMDAILRALNFLLKQCIRYYDLPGAGRLAFNVETGANEIKLGASAVAILALVKYDQLTGDTQYRPLLEQLALGIGAMQNQQNGRFVHVLHADDLKLKEAFRIVYYDGEAAFALMRLYGLTKDPRWLFLVQKAFDYFIEAKHWKHHDHWLSYCVNELTLYKPDVRYFKFGVQNISGYLDFIEQRETTFPTLLELCMAFERMLSRIQASPALVHLLDGFDLAHFYRAMHRRANHLMNGYFFPEVAMYFKKPNTVLNGFFIRHHAFRVRIDDVEHYLSGLAAYHKFLSRQQRLPTQAVQMPAVLKGHENGNLPENLLQDVRGGRLLVQVARQWNAMRAAAWQAGLVLLPVSQVDTYRPFSIQVSLFKKRFTASASMVHGSVAWAGQSWVLNSGQSPAAVPGTSSHGWGMAVDVRLDVQGRVKSWLLSHAQQFGFCWEHQSEPWHLVYFEGDHGSSVPSDDSHRLTPFIDWNCVVVQKATPGTWLPGSSKEFKANGISVWRGSYRHGDVAVLASKAGDKGMPSGFLAGLSQKPVAVITSMPMTEISQLPWMKGIPVYQVKDNSRAVMDLAHFARQQFRGKVIGVTGTAGKTTTTQMLAQSLSALGGPVSRSNGNGNLPFGVAWNLCQMDWFAPFCVVEMAIGSMDINARLARPDVAIVTNIGPSHLEYHGTTRNVALKKARIFRGVPDGGAAVVCLDTEHADLLEAEARAHQLRLYTYGEHAQATVRLIHWDAHAGRARIVTPLGQFELSMPGQGKHMVLNALACVATAVALNVALPPVLKALGQFKAVAGRGDLFQVQWGESTCAVIDESYNANPVSMVASLDYLGVLFQQGGYKRKVMILGDMLELGENSAQYHVDLSAAVAEQKPDVLLLCGSQMQYLAANLKPDDVGLLKTFADAQLVLGCLHQFLEGSDLVLVKSSHGTGLHKLVSAMRDGLVSR